MSATVIAVVVAIIGFGAGAAALGLYLHLRERLNGQSRALDSLAAFQPLFADLWSEEMPRRLAALFAAQRLAKSRGSARGLGNVLVSFIRKRLSGESEGDSFDDVRLALTILSGASVRGAQGVPDLSGIDFHGAVLSGVDLSGFRLAQCRFDRCRLAGAKLTSADLSGASLMGADLAGADLRRADFSEADFSDADFTGAKVGGANFTNTNIGGAILAEAAGLSQEQLDQAFGDGGTAVPERMRFVAGRSARSRRD